MLLTVASCIRTDICPIDQMYNSIFVFSQDNPVKEDISISILYETQCKTTG